MPDNQHQRTRVLIQEEGTSQGRIICESRYQLLGDSDEASSSTKDEYEQGTKRMELAEPPNSDLAKERKVKPEELLASSPDFH
ncbi:OLC1v1018652C1 [Oldenlandia corymbosa var. corymbosa]|uniref:OLC1v1018652C1 n=1 Tax=Oldenlandia corymbosa var. corymbosa TaxID=529605 RepID=A0AAV1EC33_OLDCO|nr:OLC1v1018652C1 [Oldenlandia corymbosa var. corymbosa]